MEKRKHINIALLFVILLGLFSDANAGNDTKNGYSANRLVMIQGSILNVYFNGTYREIKRAHTFYGYGWLDSHRVFVAYQPDDYAEASAIMEVIDVQQSKTYSLGEIGGTGESNFDVNPETKKIIFNDSDGIKLMTVDLNNLSNYKLARQIHLIKKMDTQNDSSLGWGIYWIDNHTVGYLGDLPQGKLIKINITY